MTSTTDYSWLAKTDELTPEDHAKLGQWDAASVPKPKSSDWSTSPPNASTEPQMTVKLTNYPGMGFQVSSLSPKGGGFIKVGDQQNLTAGELTGSPLTSGSLNDVTTVHVQSTVWNAKEYLEYVFTDKNGTAILKVAGLWSGGGTDLMEGTGPFVFV